MDTTPSSWAWFTHTALPLMEHRQMPVNLIEITRKACTFQLCFILCWYHWQLKCCSHSRHHVFFQHVSVAPKLFLAPKNLLAAVQRAPQPLKGHHKIIWAIHKITCTEAVFLPVPCEISEHKFHRMMEETTHCRQVTTEARETDFSMCFSAPGLPLCFGTSPNSHTSLNSTPSTHPLPSSWKRARRGRRQPASSNHHLGPKNCCRVSCQKTYPNHSDMDEGWRWAEGDLSSFTILKWKWGGHGGWWSDRWKIHLSFKLIKNKYGDYRDCCSTSNLILQ